MTGHERRLSGVVELTEDELVEWGYAVGRHAVRHGVFVCLYGELGAGKSTLARAACRGAGVSGAVPSPTFTLVNLYTASNGRPIHHADLYRIEDPAELTDMGWQELIQADGPVLLEWPERATDQLPIMRWDIHLELVRDPAMRRVTAEAVGGAPPVPPFSEGRED